MSTTWKVNGGSLPCIGFSYPLTFQMAHTYHLSVNKKACETISFLVPPQSCKHHCLLWPGWCRSAKNQKWPWVHRFSLKKTSIKQISFKGLLKSGKNMLVLFMCFWNMYIFLICVYVLHIDHYICASVFEQRQERTSFYSSTWRRHFQLIAEI